MEKIASWWKKFFQSNGTQEDWWNRKQALCRKRESEILRIHGDGHVFQTVRYDQRVIYSYLLHVSFFIKQRSFYYREEQLIPGSFRMKQDQTIEHLPIDLSTHASERHSLSRESSQDSTLQRFAYDRLAAVKYAERWWNSYNPQYEHFSVDCTNYVSQCLHAGGAPMHGAPKRTVGWWYQAHNWSYSWSVANAFRWYLSSSKNGLQGREVATAEELNLGDVICYDFEGDDKWDHSTIVVAKDADGMPLVNAHTDNSRNRYWSYEDSTAWTPQMAYKFFQIGNA